MGKKLFVLTGPSGAGISSVIESVSALRQDIGFAVPVTARKMKPGEVDGTGFWFYDLEGWEELKSSGDLIECTEFAGNDYGTSRRLVNGLLSSGRNVLLNLSPERAAQIKANMPEAVCVFVCPSEAVLRERYTALSRSELELNVRMLEAERLSSLCGFCDVTVCSDDPEQAAERICGLMS